MFRECGHCSCPNTAVHSRQFSISQLCVVRGATLQRAWCQSLLVAPGGCVSYVHLELIFGFSRYSHLLACGFVNLHSRISFCPACTTQSHSVASVPDQTSVGVRVSSMPRIFVRVKISSGISFQYAPFASISIRFAASFQFRLCWWCAACPSRHLVSVLFRLFEGLVPSILVIRPFRVIRVGCVHTAPWCSTDPSRVIASVPQLPSVTFTITCRCSIPSPIRRQLSAV